MNSTFFVNWFRRNWVLNGEMTRNTCSTQEFREGFKKTSCKLCRTIIFLLKEKETKMSDSISIILSQQTKVDSAARNSIFTNPVAPAKTYDSTDQDN
jgi:hypothetical protein